MGHVQPSGCLTALERNTFLVHLFLFSMFGVLLSWWIFKLSALADTVPLSCLWNIPCVVQASEHLLIVELFSLCRCLYWLGRKKPSSMQLFLAVGVWNLSEWKCICVTSSESALVGWKCNTGSMCAGFTHLYCQNPVFWAVSPSADLLWTRVQPSVLLGRKPCGVTQMHAGVLVPTECQHLSVGYRSQPIKSDLPSLQRRNCSRKQWERKRR